MVKTKVIAIASVSGGGKTTITKESRKRLKKSKALFFDEYDFEGAPDDLIQWVEEGPDYNQWDLEPLAADIDLLLEDEDPPAYIILDYPFSYQNDRLKNFIDLSIYIETPLDIAMARRLLRDYHNTTTFEVHNDLIFYMKFGRGAYLEMENTIKPNSDIIIDGASTVNEIVDTTLQNVRM
ncbi:hypothetical protein GCM10010954_11370 [Halobacillus andaensis]|uniref:Uridine kinase n=1 Tax=Halobacillus andaensis TaxID=1176239 RepID=A0A917B1D4_HALAA|nr:hypothetical protein [Halobacillus andaensis]MBP2003933.1 uridine kinase [Halobacillus andaensis]GGF14471.1 hypothetical protein GCM10010954_11370 [Halobacillus andaensis]